MNQPDNIRNLSILGHIHHGKTTFVDMLVKNTHKKYSETSKEVKKINKNKVALYGHKNR
jgi:116 kDa U5 small nuclear ribonucleoprotein component